MIKKFGLLVALIASLAGCGKETKSTGIGNSNPDTPLVGCYKWENAKQGEYIRVTESSGKYQIESLPNPDNEGWDIYYKISSGSADILEAISVFKSSEEGKKKFSEMVEFVLTGENQEKTNIIFFKVKKELEKQFGHEYSIIIDGEPMGVIKFDCQK